MSSKNVGVVGLGAMGLGIARSLLRNGFNVHACDVRAAVTEQFATEGGVACATPAALAAACDVIITVVVNADQTETVLFGENGAVAALRPGALVIGCATVAPEFAVRLGERLGAAGFLYLDAPISGGAAKAASGDMTMMTSGPADAYAIADPILQGMAGKIYRLGDVHGLGSKTKIINQLLAGVHIAASAEAMALGLREGVDPDALYEVITNSAGNSWMFENRVPHILKADYTPLSATAHQMFMQASSAGYGREDDSAVIKIFPGITLPVPKNDK